jgi:hypothetical protein
MIKKNLTGIISHITGTIPLNIFKFLNQLNSGVKKVFFKSVKSVSVLVLTFREFNS